MKMCSKAKALHTCVFYDIKKKNSFPGKTQLKEVSWLNLLKKYTGLFRRICDTHAFCWQLNSGATAAVNQRWNNFWSELNINTWTIVFLCPRVQRSGGILFWSCLSLCHSVIMSFCHDLWNFNLANNFWTVNARAWIFHMSIPCDKTFSWVPLFFTLWAWPWSLTHFLKTLTLLITF